MGNLFAAIALFGWVPVVALVFIALPPRRAVIAAFLGAWLFLPMTAVKLGEGIPAYDKMGATCIGVLLCVFLFDVRRLQTFRPGWIDLPMLIWCLCPMASSLSNDLGFYDGLSAVFGHLVGWGLPYFIGRAYFRDLASMRELAIGLFIGGLIYVPLCLVEIRLSPQLHRGVYGFQQQAFTQAIRWNGFRPTVFMQHGLMVGMWMCMTGLIGVWLWSSRSVRALWHVPAVYWVLALLGTAVLCKSTGAVVLLAAGLAALFVTRLVRSRVIVWGLVAAAPLYMAFRGSGLWDGATLSEWASVAIGEVQGGSLQYRMHNEDILAAKAMQRPILGWGAWGRARVYDESGRDISITDGLWIITLGNQGIVGLASLTLTMLLPAGLMLRRYPVRAWREPAVAPAIVLAVVVVLYWIDCIPNGMVNPIFMLAVGGLAGTATPMSLRRDQGAHPLIGTSSPLRVSARLALDL